MKGIFKTSLLAMTGLMLATSCSNEDLFSNSNENEGLVTFSVGIENVIGSRAVSDGTGANKLVYQLYNSNGSPIGDQGVLEDITFPYESLSLRLAKGQTYQIAFWAQNKETKAYGTTDLKAVSIDYSEALNNDESRDAFFKTQIFTVSENMKVSVVLHRPFAQVNLGDVIEDWKAAQDAGMNITQSKVELANVANEINLLTGEVSGAVPVVFAFNNIFAKDSDDEFLMVDVNKDGEIDENENQAEKTRYLSMCYILANDETNGSQKTTLDNIKFTLKNPGGKDYVFDQGLSNVPVQRNWRTNILGSFLTTQVTFSIEIDPAYYGDYNNVDGSETDSNYANVAGLSFSKTDKTFYVASLAALQWIRNQSNLTKNWDANTANGKFTGITVKLTSDINLTGTWTPIASAADANFAGTFDGSGFTISNLKISLNTNANAGFFNHAVGGTIKNLNINNVNITSHWSTGAIVGHGMCTYIENCHVDGGKITVTPDSDNDNANNVGGIVGYLSAEPNAYVKDCTVRNLVIRAYRDVAGIVGTVTGGANATVTGNAVENVTVIADQTYAYKEEGKTANAGEIYGRNLASNDVVKDNSFNNVSVVVLNVDEDGKLEVSNVPLQSLPDLSASSATEVEELVLESDITGDARDNAYSATNMTGLRIGNGRTVDGQGHTITVNGANNTWDSAVVINNGTLKNATLVGAFRGVFINMDNKGDVYLENVKVKKGSGIVYPINVNEGNKTCKVTAKDCEFAGWSSWSGCSEIEFENCYFSDGDAYRDAYANHLIRPYRTTLFKNCSFDPDFNMLLDAVGEDQTITFDQCTVNGVILTESNYRELIKGETYNWTGVEKLTGRIIFK